VTLLERHGIVCRESVAIEEIAGGFQALYPVYREMEEAGRIRRGYFVDGLGGAQFTLPGAVDRLRAVANRDNPTGVVVLAAGDPANPYGWLVPWPDSPGDGAAARRATGAFVILRGGVPVFFVDRGGKRMVSFEAARDAEAATDAVAGLVIVARHQRGKALRVATIDGERARGSALADILLVSGFYAESNGLVLEAR
jgi:ATP-dependent Lhr-like helicase